MVLYQDNHLIFVDKPAGMPSQPDESGDLSVLDWVKAYLKERYNKPGEAFAGLVHRLDRPASGVMVVARTSKAASRLFSQFQEHTVEKTYLARVCGQPAPEASLADWLLREERRSRVVPPGTPGAREARLRYRLLDVCGDFSVLEVELETGRHHQIRAQLAALGHPIVGDIKYGAPAPLPDKSIALHAQRLRLLHPVRREPLEVSSPPPW